MLSVCSIYCRVADNFPTGSEQKNKGSCPRIFCSPPTPHLPVTYRCLIEKGAGEIDFKCYRIQVRHLRFCLCDEPLGLNYSLVGASGRSVRYYESGERQPATLTLVKIRRLFEEQGFKSEQQREQGSEQQREQADVVTVQSEQTQIAETAEVVRGAREVEDKSINTRPALKSCKDCPLKDGSFVDGEGNSSNGIYDSSVRVKTKCNHVVDGGNVRKNIKRNNVIDGSNVKTLKRNNSI